MSEQAIQGPPEVVYSASYTYSFADYQASRGARRKLNPIEAALWPWRYALFLGVNLPILGLVIWNSDLSGEEILSWSFLSQAGLLYAGALALMGLLDLLLDRVLPAWVFKRYSLARKPLILAFDASGIIWSSEGIKGELTWSSVKSVVTFEGSAFLFISKLEALCVPQRAFLSKDTFDRFVLYAKERVNG